MILYHLWTKIFIKMFNLNYKLIQQFFIWKGFYSLGLNISFGNCYKTSQYDEMNITNTSIEKNMSKKFYIKQPRQCFDLNLKMINSKKPRLINALDRKINCPSI